MADWRQALGAGLTAFGSGMTGGNPMAAGMDYLKQRDSMADKERESQIIKGVFGAKMGDQSNASDPLAVADGGTSQATPSGGNTGMGGVISYFKKNNIPLPQTMPELKTFLEVNALEGKDLEKQYNLLIKQGKVADIPMEQRKLAAQTEIEEAKIAEQRAQTASALARAPIDKEIFYESALRQYPQLNMTDPQISQRIMPRAAEIASSYMTATDPVTGKVTSTGMNVDEAMNKALYQLGVVQGADTSWKPFSKEEAGNKLKEPGIIPDSPGSRTMLTQELSARVKELIDLGVKEDVARRIAQNDIKKNPKWGQVIAARAKELISQQQGNVQ